MRIALILLICLCTRIYAGAGILVAKSTAMGLGLHGGFAARVIDGKFHPAGAVGVSGNLFYNFDARNALEIGISLKTLANSTWSYYSGAHAGYTYFGRGDWFFRAGAGIEFGLNRVEFLLTPYIGGGYILGINKMVGMTFSAAVEVPVRMQPWAARGADVTLGVGMIFATKKGEKK